MKLLHLLVLMLLFCSFQPPKKKKHRSIREENIPGVVQIDDRLYMDDTEISNFEWMEYHWWMRRVYGEESPEYLSEQPDTLVWNEARGNALEATSLFYNHPAYRHYPIVGISYEQMQRYCKWRSDRVFEYMLIRTGRIAPEPDQNADDCFTIERYMSGQYKDYVPDPAITEVPHYYLPSKEEWVKASAYATNVYNALPPRKRRKGPDAYYSSLTGTDLTQPVKPDKKHCIRGAIYNLHRNVSEQLSDPQLMAGGNWKNKGVLAEDEDFSFTGGPSIEKGFRCAFQWRPMEITPAQ